MKEEQDSRAQTFRDFREAQETDSVRLLSSWTRYRPSLCFRLELVLFLDQLVELVKTVALLLAFVSDHCAHRLAHRRTQRRSRRHEDATDEDGNGCISDDLGEGFSVRHIDVATINDTNKAGTLREVNIVRAAHPTFLHTFIEVCFRGFGARGFSDRRYRL